HVDRLGRDRGVHEVDVRIREAGKRGLVRCELEPSRRRTREAIDVADGAGGDDLPRLDADRLDPAVADVSGKGRDPAGQERVQGQRSRAISPSTMTRRGRTWA